jgi:uncharacterized protein
MTTPRKILADSGYFAALFNTKDHHHRRCKEFFDHYSGQVITTWSVMTEVSFLLSPARLKAFFEWASKAQGYGHLLMESPPAESLMQLWTLIEKYEGLPMDFCDAGLVYLASSLKIRHIATVDARDFSVYRLPGNQNFIHVLDI